MAKTAFEFVVEHMHDPATDLFRWTVTQDGQLLQDNKVIYGQWFVLYSFRCDIPYAQRQGRGARGWKGCDCVLREARELLAAVDSG